MLKKHHINHTKLYYLFSKKYYFISSARIETFYRKDGTSYSFPEYREWGFFTSKKKAIKAVTENWTDINECGYYPWALISVKGKGLLADRYDMPRMWFKESYTKLSDEQLQEIYNKCPEDKRTYCTVNQTTNAAYWYDPDKQCITSNFNGYIPCEDPFTDFLL